MTLVEIVLLMAGGMPIFESLCHAFGTAGTGGFGVWNSSIGGYNDYLITVITVFMILFGVNFNVYYLMFIRKWEKAFSCEELRWYLIIIAVAIGIITVDIHGMYESVGQSLKHAAFQVASIITTTGYSTTDFDLWPQTSRMILVLLMFIGACAGSTGGGIKVSRVVILVKSIKNELETLLHPRSVRRVYAEGRPVENEMLRSIFVFMATYFILFAISMAVVTLDGFTMTTNFTAVAATLNNVGPGLSGVGPMMNYHAFSDLSKFVLMFDMLAGRLELFPVLLCFYPPTWKKHN